MKPAIDPDFVVAIAKAVLNPENTTCRNETPFYRPEGDASVALHLENLADRYPGADGTCDGLCEAFDRAFQFALQLGARIGAEPTYLPEVKDLIKKYRFEKEEAA